MEQYGFARSKVAGEYSPRISYATLQADASKSGTTFSTLLTAYITTDSPNESIVVLWSVAGLVTGTSGNTPWFQVLVDGVSKATMRGPTSALAAFWCVRETAAISGLAPGYHKVELQWRSASTDSIACKPVTSFNKNHATLVVARSQTVSDKEMESFGLASWPAFYSPGLNYVDPITTTQSDTNSSPTVSLFSTTTYTSRHPHSALLCRFSVAGTGPTGTTSGTTLNDSAKFAAYVDGVLACGTGQLGLDHSASSRFVAAMSFVVAVEAGVHTIEIKWCGGSRGGTITPSSGTEGAELEIEEVFCEDVGNLVTDAGGFCTTYYAAGNLPQVRYASLTSDATGQLNDPGLEILSIDDLRVDSENSVFLVEISHCGTPNNFGGADRVSLHIDGNDVRYAASNQFSGSGLGLLQGHLLYLAVLQSGYHKVRVGYQLDSDTIYAATHPEYNHCNLIVRELAGSGAYIQNVANA